jgi:hypothetical protein
MIRNAIEKILELAMPEIIEIGELEYSSKPLTLVRPPRTQTLQVKTLTGIVDYLAWEKPQPTDALHVVDERTVSLITQGDETYKDREKILTAQHSDRSLFKFDQFLELENFIIGLQSAFVRDESTEKVLSVLGNVKDKEVKNFNDDGITQSVTAKSGVSMVKEVPVPNPVILRPYRTFLEIEQPQSAFILRLRSGGGQSPVAALFLADGLQWELTAMQSIKAWLTEKTTGIPVIA